MLDTDLLRGFVAVADTGSFTRAGERLGRTQSAVSMQMKRLEEVVGKPLLNREPRKVTLTHEGQVLLDHAHRILRMGEEALRSLRDPGLTGKVRFGMPDDYALRYLPPILRAFSTGHPEVQVDVEIAGTEFLIDRLQRGELDLMVGSCGHGGEDTLVLLDEPSAWVTSGEHDIHHNRPLPLALFQSGCGIRRAALRALEMENVPHRLAVTSVSIATLQAAVLSGIAVAAFGRNFILPGMRILSPEDGFPTLPTTSIGLERSRSATDPVVDALQEHVIASLRCLADAAPARPHPGVAA